MTEFVEISEYLAARITEADERVDELSDQLHKAQHERQKLLDDAVREIAEFTVGQEVLSFGKRYRVTRVFGEEFGLQGHRAKIWLRYSGDKLKINGEPTGRERRLYDISALSTQSIVTD